MMHLHRTVCAILLQMRRNQNCQKNHSRGPHRTESLHLSSKLVFCFLCCSCLPLRKTSLHQIRRTRSVIRKRVSKLVFDQSLCRYRPHLPKLAYVQTKLPRQEYARHQQTQVFVHLRVSVMEDRQDLNAWQRAGLASC